MNRVSLTSIATALAVVAVPCRAAHADEPSIVEIRVAKSIEEPDNVNAWMQRAADDAIEAAGVEAAGVGGRRLVIDVGGVMFDYQLVVGVQADGKWVGEKRESRCECNDQELVDHVRGDVTKVAPSLREEPASSSTGGAAAESPADPTGTDRAPAGARMQPLGVAGATMVAIGGAAAITGIALVIVGSRESNPRPSDRKAVDYRPAGIVTLSVGLAVVVAGATMLGIERARARRKSTMSVVPSFDGRSATLVWSGRF